jgi:Cu/Ag efflux protein CusF
MRIGKAVVAAALAVGLGSSCAFAQVATFTAVVSKIDQASGTISLKQNIPAKPTSAGTVDTAATTATGDYKVGNAALFTAAAVGDTVQATVERVNGQPTITGLQK